MATPGPVLPGGGGRGGGRGGNQTPELRLDIISPPNANRRVEVRARLTRGGNPFRGDIIFGIGDEQIPGSEQANVSEARLTVTVPRTPDQFIVWAECSNVAGVRRAQQRVTFPAPPAPPAVRQPPTFDIEPVLIGPVPNARGRIWYRWMLTLRTSDKVTLAPRAETAYINFGKFVSCGIGNIPGSVIANVVPNYSYAVTIPASGIASIIVDIRDSVVEYDAFAGGTKIDDRRLFGAPDAPSTRPGLFNRWGVGHQEYWPRLVLGVLWFSALGVAASAELLHGWSLALGAVVFGVFMLLSSIAYSSGASPFARAWNTLLGVPMKRNNRLLACGWVTVIIVGFLMFSTEPGTPPFVEYKATRQQQQTLNSHQEFGQRFSNRMLHKEDSTDEERSTEPPVEIRSGTPLMIRILCFLFLLFSAVIYTPIAFGDEGKRFSRRFGAGAAGIAGAPGSFEKLGNIIKHFRQGRAVTATPCQPTETVVRQASNKLDWINLFFNVMDWINEKLPALMGHRRP